MLLLYIEYYSVKYLSSWERRIQSNQMMLTNPFLQVNIWLNIFLHCREKYKDMIDHCSYTHNSSSCKIKPEKNLVLEGIQTHDLCICQCSALLAELHQANCELVTFWVHNYIPVDGEDCKWIYEISYIWTAEKDEHMIDYHIYTHNLSSYKSNPE